MPTLKTHKHALFNYDVLETYEAGIALTGPEVKSAKRGHVQLDGSYVSVRPDGAWLINCHISPYARATAAQQPDPTRERRLLLRASELRSLVGKTRAQGLTLIPLGFFSQRGLVKVRLGLARGRKKQDKRAAIKRREVERDIRRRFAS